MAKRGGTGTFTAGHGTSRLYEATSVFRSHRRNDIDHAVYMAKLAREITERTKTQDHAYVMDLGCGSRAAVPLALTALGTRNVGFDYDVVSAKRSVTTAIRVAKHNGVERAAKTIARMVLFDGSYYRALEAALGVPLNFSALDVRQGNAESIDFPDNTFSYINSVWAFEHFSNVPKVVEEIARVLRPGGVASIGVHLFPSLSGGHAMDYDDSETPESTVVEPWDHLRKNRHPAHVYLNRLRADDYLRAFSDHLEIEDVQYSTEGESLLTDEVLREELSDWAYEDLTRRTLVARLVKTV